MLPNESVVAEERGYHILKGADGQSLIFIDQATNGPIRFTGICAGLALAFVVFAVILFQVYFDGKETLSLGVPLTSSALALLMAGLALRALWTYRQRKASAGKRLVLKHGQLEDEQGNRLAQGDLSVRTGYDWTDSPVGFRFAMLVKLCWSGGQITVFRTFNHARRATVLEALAQAGVGSPR